MMKISKFVNVMIDIMMMEFQNYVLNAITLGFLINFFLLHAES